MNSDLETEISEALNTDKHMEELYTEAAETFIAFMKSRGGTETTIPFIPDAVVISLIQKGHTVSKHPTGYLVSWINEDNPDVVGKKSIT